MLRLAPKDAVMASLMVVAACTAEDSGPSADSGASSGRRDASSVANDSGAAGPMDAFFADAAGGADANPGSGPDATTDAGAMTPDAGMMALCPPQGPYGSRQDDTIPPVMLKDCDGNLHNLHDLCQKRASWFFVFAGW